jgi:hypothetical protein
MNPGGFSLAGMADRAKWRALRQQLEQQLANTAVGAGGSQGGGQRSDVGNTTHIVKIDLGGKRRSFNASSAADAAIAADIFREIEEAANRSR